MLLQRLILSQARVKSRRKYALLYLVLHYPFSGGTNLLCKEKGRKYYQKGPEDVADWRCGGKLQRRQTIVIIHQHCRAKRMKTTLKTKNVTNAKEQSCAAVQQESTLTLDK